jgi:hypothetical protein
VMQRQRGQDPVAESWRVGETVAVGWTEEDALVLIDDGEHEQVFEDIGLMEAPSGGR